MKALRFIAFIAFIGLSTLSCTITKPIARQAIDFNRALEKAKNQQLLINVVRSSLRLPTHYTALSQLLGTASTGLTPTAQIPFGGDATSVYGLSLTGSAAAGVATVSMATLDSQNFVQGIMSPLSIDNFDYYQKQGWSEELILLLFVRKLVIDGQEYLNQPTTDFKEMDRFIEKIRSIEFTVKNEKGAAVGPSFELGKTESIAALILQGKGAGLELAQVADQSSGSDPKTVKYEFRKMQGGKSLFLGESKTFSAHSDTEAQPKNKNTVYFRSTDAIFTYLGEIMRYMNPSNPKPKVRVMKEDGTGEQEVALFLAERAHKDIKGDAQVRVSHLGHEYVIPGSSGGIEHRTMDVLALLSQLISLHKSSTEIPGSGVVTVSGG